MNRQPKITIITACYNSEKYIEQTIQSVIEQTYANIEYIIVDGKSSDRTMEIVNKYNNQIDIIISEPDKGIYDAFNKGIKASTGDIILFLNSDDYLYSSNIIGKVANIFSDNKEVKILYGKILMVNENNGYFRHHGDKVTDINYFQKGKMPPHPSLFVKRELFDEFDYFNTAYTIAADFDFVLKCFKKYLSNTHFLDEVVSLFRLGGISTNLNQKHKTRLETIKIIVENFKVSQLKPLSNSELNIFYYKKWIEHLLNGNTISDVVYQEGIRKVAVFGTMEMALYVVKDLSENNITVSAFLDNDKMRQGNQMAGITIYHPNWLGENVKKIDAIILAFEGNYEDEVTEQIISICKENRIEVYSWRNLIEKSMN